MNSATWLGRAQGLDRVLVVLQSGRLDAQCILVTQHAYSFDLTIEQSFASTSKMSLNGIITAIDSRYLIERTMYMCNTESANKYVHFSGLWSDVAQPDSEFNLIRGPYHNESNIAYLCVITIAFDTTIEAILC